MNSRLQEEKSAKQTHAESLDCLQPAKQLMPQADAYCDATMSFRAPSISSVEEHGKVMPSIESQDPKDALSKLQGLAGERGMFGGLPHGLEAPETSHEEGPLQVRPRMSLYTAESSLQLAEGHV